MRLTKTDGNPAGARLTWTPSKAQVGQYKVTLTALTELPSGGAQRTIVIRVGPANKQPPGPPPPPGVYPPRSVLSDMSKETYRWAFVRSRTVAGSGPSQQAPARTRI